MSKYKYHFTPPKGWMNDPNGTIYIDGVYHMFYQYYPDDIKWGPMHWGHATSTDLVNWEHQEIALFPDEDGYIFSGSCIYDSEGVTGIGDCFHKPLLAFYTRHNPETGEEEQCVAYSLDFTHFYKYAGNPLIRNKKSDIGFLKDFRDPKVIPNKVLGGYTMLLAANDKVMFYNSSDLLRWEKAGEFAFAEIGYPGLCECPDMLLLDGKYVLVISMVVAECNARLVQYFVGDFDGYKFINTQAFNEEQLIDFGADAYATTSFSNAPVPTVISWGEHWDDVYDRPANDTRGKMTLAREVRLVETERGYRLAFNPVGVEPIEVKIKENEFIDISGLRITVTSDEIMINRSCFKRPNFCAKRYTKGAATIKYITDGDYIEVYSECGIIVFSLQHY